MIIQNRGVEFFIPPTSKKLRGHIGLPYLCLCVHYALHMSRMVRDRILKFNIFSKHEKYADPYFFCLSVGLTSYPIFSTFAL